MENYFIFEGGEHMRHEKRSLLEHIVQDEYVVSQCEQRLGPLLEQQERIISEFAELEDMLRIAKEQEDTAGAQDIEHQLNEKEQEYYHVQVACAEIMADIAYLERRSAAHTDVVFDTYLTDEERIRN